MVDNYGKWFDVIIEEHRNPGGRSVITTIQKEIKSLEERIAAKQRYLGKMIDKYLYVPDRGSVLIKNDTTGSITEIPIGTKPGMDKPLDTMSISQSEWVQYTELMRYKEYLSTLKEKLVSYLRGQIPPDTIVDDAYRKLYRYMEENNIDYIGYMAHDRIYYLSIDTMVLESIPIVTVEPDIESMYLLAC